MTISRSRFEIGTLTGVQERAADKALERSFQQTLDEMTRMVARPSDEVRDPLQRVAEVLSKLFSRHNSPIKK